MHHNNPFAALSQNTNNPTLTETKTDRSNEKNNFSEIVFQITLNPLFKNESNEAFVFMGDDPNKSNLLSEQNLDELLLERLMLTDAEYINDQRRPREKPLKTGVIKEHFFYLFECFERLENLKRKFIQTSLSDHYEFIYNLIINMCRTVISIIEPEQEPLSKKFFNLIITYGAESEHFSKFYQSFIKLIDNSDNFFSSEANDLDELIEDPLELKFLTDIFYYFNQSINIQTFDIYSNEFRKNLDLLRLITGSKLMKYLFVKCSFLAESGQTRGKSWQTDTLIGKLLTPSVLPLEQYKFQSLFGEPQHQFRYFLNTSHMTRQDAEINEKNMHQAQRMINREISSFFYDHLVKTNSNAKIRNMWLGWCSKCMTDNKAKCQEWSNFGQNPMNMFSNKSNYPSEGFWLNLLDIFLTYSMPFCADGLQNSSKLLKINYNYTNPDIKDKNLTLLDSETKFIPNRDTTKVQDEHVNFNFITESFYYTHNLIRFSYLSMYQKLIKINNELAKWQEMYQDLAHSTDPQMSRIKTMFENMSCEFLNMQGVMTEEGLIKKLSKFLFNTALWLSFVSTKAQKSNFDAEKSQNLEPLSQVDFLSKETNSFNLDILAVIPEFLLTNIVEFLTCINRFKETLLPDLFMDRLSGKNEPEFPIWYLYLILSFMGRSDRLFNPHIRAQIAESIECLLPRQNPVLVEFQKNLSKQIFLDKQYSALICESLINVFVSIEMSGQSVQFEQKFNYRRPMYELFDYLWNLPTQNASPEYRKHRDELKKMADFALENIENHEQPLFLKFLNYLINDANYLLVEGLLLLEKIKTSQDKLELDKVEKNLNNQQRSELESGLKQMIMMAKFHNLMSLKTIQTIKMLTDEIKDLLCHQVLVDRIATMLNDFLLHLVGKKKRKQLKVKNFEEVKFKPKEVVSIICDIYLNLGENRHFCEAICRDGRSYSSDLFQSAIEVLQQIGRDPIWVQQFVLFYKKVNGVAEQLKLEEANFDDAPDEFLDPIMSCLMEDPVLLPSSKQIVDKSTISRHLLSDQTDPFNRSPLTLQEVVPATDLKKRIDEWKKSKLSISNSQ